MARAITLVERSAALFLVAIIVAVTAIGLAENAQAEEAITPTDPELKDQSGNSLASVVTGQLTVISTTITNNSEESKQFTAIIEVRDSKGVTLFLGWQSGTVNPGGEVEVALSWTPKEAGTYHFRTFLISGFKELEVLSGVKTSEAVIE